MSTTERNVDLLLSVRKTEFYSIKMYAFAFLHIGEYVKIQILCLKAEILLLSMVQCCNEKCMAFARNYAVQCLQGWFALPDKKKLSHPLKSNKPGI